MVEALNHVGRLLFKCVIILLELTIFSINASGKVFKNQIGSFNCHSEKVLYLLRCNIFDDTCYVGKTRTKFRLRFNKYESKHQSFWKGKQNVSLKRFYSHYVKDCCKGIDDWEVTSFSNCKMKKQLNEREKLMNEYLFFYLFVYVSIYYLFISKTTEQKVSYSFFPFFLLLSLYLLTLSTVFVRFDLV